MSTSHKIDFWTIFKNTYLFFFRNFFSYLKMASVWWLFVIPVSLYIAIYGLPAVNEPISFTHMQDIAALLTGASNFLMPFVITPMFFILFTRKAVLKKDFPKKWLYFSYGKKELLYLLYSIVLGIFLILGCGLIILLLLFGGRYIVHFLLNHITSYVGLSSQTLTMINDFIVYGIIAFSAFILSSWVIRSTLILPALACDDSKGFFRSLKAALAVTKGQTVCFSFLFLGIAVSQIIVGLLLTLPLSGIMWLGLIFKLPWSLIESISFLIGCVIEIVLLGMSSSFLGTVYTEKRKEFLLYLKEKKLTHP